MEGTGGNVAYGTYWKIWIILLTLTVIMLAVEGLGLPAGVAVIVLIAAMMTKATLIGGWFMHLRYEKLVIMLCIVLGTLLAAAFLFFLIMPDGRASLPQ